MLVTMNDILLPAKREGYGVGFFNAINVEMARAVIGAAQKGICKVNIFTDVDKAGKVGVEAGITAGAGSMLSLIPYEIEAIKKAAIEKIQLFGSENRA